MSRSINLPKFTLLIAFILLNFTFATLISAAPVPGNQIDAYTCPSDTPPSVCESVKQIDEYLKGLKYSNEPLPEINLDTHFKCPPKKSPRNLRGLSEDRRLGKKDEEAAHCCRDGWG